MFGISAGTTIELAMHSRMAGASSTEGLSVFSAWQYSKNEFSQKYQYGKNEFSQKYNIQ
jgi:hypothetical protein